MCLLLVVGTAFLAAPAADITTSIQIDATPAQVWAVLADTPDYPAWNPDMRLLGRLQEGQVIEHDEGQGPDRMVFHPVVLTAQPGRELRWFGRLWVPRLFDATHYFLLTPRDGGTWFTQGEQFRGVALWLFDVAQLRPGFEAMDAALKRRVEGR